MRRADRLLQIVQILRRANGQPVSAGQISQELEVTKRTIYRDMVALESINVPVRGEAGLDMCSRAAWICRRLSSIQRNLKP